MPTGSQSWLALVPRDAHTLMIAEVESIRETPHAAEMLADARLAEENEDGEPPDDVPGVATPPMGAMPLPPEMETQNPGMSPDQFARRVERIDRVAIAVGGLMATPYNPDLENLPSEAREFREIMAVFGDQIPTFVAIFQGEDAAAVCQDGQGDAATRSLEGYTVAVTEHAAFLVRGDVCTVTMRGAYSSLLEERDLPLPTIVSRAQPVSAPHTPEGASRLFSFATDHRSEGAQELWDAWRASDQRAAQDARDREAAEEQGDDPDQSLAQFTRAMSDATRRMRIAMRVFFQVLNEHVVGTAWTVWRSPTGYHIASRTEYDDDDRATMWREWATIYSNILRGLVDEGAMPDEAAEVVSPVLDSAFVEESGNELHIGYAITDTWIADVRRRVEEENNGGVGSSDGTPATDDELSELRDMLNASHGNPDEVIAGLHGKQTQIAAIEHAALRHQLVMRLGSAYADRGRYPEAASTFARVRQGSGSGHDWETASRLGFYGETSPCEVLDAETQVHIEYGQAEAALAAIEATNEQCSPYQSTSLRADALLALGRFDEAAAVYSQAGGLMADAATAAVRLRVARGQMTEAAAIAEAICPQLNTPSCERIAGEILTARAAVAASASPLVEELEALRRSPPSDAIGAHAAATECSLRQRLEARSADTETACRRAVDVAIATYSENHPRVAMARMALATTLRARRNRSEATAQREAAAPIIATLGPSHPLRQNP